MKYINNKIIAFTLIAASIMSCTDEYNCQLQVEKPQNAAINEYLAQFDLLKSYIDRSGTPFQLAVNVPGSEFVKKEIAFSTVFTNFDAVDMNGSYDPLNTLKEDGTYNFGGMQTAADVAAEAGVTLYGGVLCSNQGQRAAYYNKLIEPIDIPVEVQKGTTKLFNFENDAIGTTYPMTGNSSATVEEDPAGESGHVLHVGTNDVKAAYSYPKFHVVLPAGRKLGDYVRLNIDLRFVGTDGIWGQGLRVLINGTEFNVGKNGDGFCDGGDKWKREGTINLKDDTAPGYDIPWRKTHQLLIEAALNTPGVVDDPRPFVLETSLQDYYPVYQVNAYIKDANQLAQVYSDLHQNIQDRFNEEGIEIMSPHYIATRDGSETTIPKDDLRGKK